MTRGGWWTNGMLNWKINFRISGAMNILSCPIICMQSSRIQALCPDDDRHGHTSGEHTGSPLHRVIQWFKTMTTNEYIRGVKQYGWVPFPGRLWQRNYYEHIVRNENEMSRIREYIRNNPVQWATDKDNPFIEDKNS